MFKDVFEEYADRRVELKLRINKTNEDIAGNIVELNSNISKSLNSQVEILHENQKKIDGQCRVVRTEAEKLVAQNQNWMKMYSNLNNSLKKVGDLTNWAMILEKEMGEVSAAITKLVTK